MVQLCAVAQVELEEVTGDAAPEEIAWLDELELLAFGWPEVELPNEDFGSVQGFARLAEDSLN